jgi:putative transposase
MNGYNEILMPQKRYGVIDHQELRRLCGIPDPERFKEEYRQWVGAALASGSIERESSRTESVAVGNLEFVEEIRAHLGIQAIGRKIRGGVGPR